MEKKKTVEKILRQQDLDRMRTKKRLDEKAKSVAALQTEKNSNKWQIEKQRIIEEFEKMKNSGRLNKKVLAKMGIELPDKKELKENIKNRRARSTMGSSFYNSENRSQQSLGNTMKPVKPTKPLDPIKPQNPTKPQNSQGYNTVQSPPKENNESIQNQKTQKKQAPVFKDNNKQTAATTRPNQSPPQTHKPTPYERNNNPLKSKPKPKQPVTSRTNRKSDKV